MKIKFDKEEKVVKVGLFSEDKEEAVQKWIFIQIYKPKRTKFVFDSMKQEQNVFELAFNV